MKRKLLSLLFASLMLVTCFTGCGKKENESSELISTDSNFNTQQQQESTTNTENSTQEDNNTENSEQETTVYNPNGFGFSISKKCLDDYLDHIASGNAYNDYARAEIEESQITQEMWENDGDRLQYFSIAGMYGEEPFLLLSSTNDTNECGDETYFIVYRPADGEFLEGIEMLGNFELPSFDYRKRMYAETTALYVCTEEWSRGAQFVYHEISSFLNPDTREEIKSEKHSIIYRSFNSASCEEVNNIYGTYESYIEKGSLAEIKWFSINQVEEARKYYQQYVRGNDASAETVNREDYFNGNTPLQYLEYFEDGVLEVQEKNGQQIYVFTGLEYEKASSLVFHTKIPNSVSFFLGSDSMNMEYFIIEKSDGTLECISITMTSGGAGDKITIKYVTDENEAISDYLVNNQWNMDPSEYPSTMQELYERIKEQEY